MKSLVVLFVVIAFFAIGEALKCYECHSLTNSKCSDPFNKTAGVAERSFYPGCLCSKEIVTAINFNYTHRTCLLSDYSNSNVARATSRSTISASLELCNTDLCNGESMNPHHGNGSNSITAALSTLVTLSIALLLTR